jgi:hypothetical protein
MTRANSEIVRRDNTSGLRAARTGTQGLTLKQHAGLLMIQSSVRPELEPGARAPTPHPSVPGVSVPQHLKPWRRGQNSAGATRALQLACDRPALQRQSWRLILAGMPRKPKRPLPTSWNIYKVAKKAIWLGTVEAPDKATAIEKGAQEFKTEAWRLYAVARR